MRNKALISIVPIVFMAFSTGQNKLKTEYYYNLQFLKSAEGPRKVEMIKTDRTSKDDKLLSRGILFTFRSRAAKHVKIAGNFSFWKLSPMRRSKNGIWYFFLNNYKSSKEIKYKFMVDGSWIMDPENPDRADDGIGSYVSVITPFESSEGKHITYRIVNRNTIEFRIYHPDARLISLVGDFNHWNPENDLLTKGNDGIWRIRKRIPSGVYRYKYIIDGKWLPDLYNSRSGSDNTGEVCSIIEVE